MRYRILPAIALLLATTDAKAQRDTFSLPRVTLNTSMILIWITRSVDLGIEAKVSRRYSLGITAKKHLNLLRPPRMIESNSWGYALRFNYYFLKPKLYGQHIYFNYSVERTKMIYNAHFTTNTIEYDKHLYFIQNIQSLVPCYGLFMYNAARRFGLKCGVGLGIGRSETKIPGATPEEESAMQQKNSDLQHFAPGTKTFIAINLDFSLTYTLFR